MATWLKVTLNIFLAAVLVACSVVLTLYSDLFDKDKKYTYNDLQEAYNTGYAKASAVVADLQSKINELETSNSLKTEQIIDLQAQIEALQNTNSQLEIDKQALEQQVLELQNIIAQKDLEIADLKAEIERLKEELEVYLTVEEYITVSFYSEGELFKTMSVRKGGSILIDVEDPENYKRFYGWSNGSDIVDISTYQFNENTVLTAVYYNAKCVVNVSFENPGQHPEGTGSTGTMCDVKISGGVAEQSYSYMFLYGSTESITFNYMATGNYDLIVGASLGYTATADIEQFEISGINDIVTINITVSYTG